MTYMSIEANFSFAGQVQSSSKSHLQSACHIVSCAWFGKSSDAGYTQKSWGLRVPWTVCLFKCHPTMRAAMRCHLHGLIWTDSDRASHCSNYF